jgi:diguanylate cyclase (GGDEF)-like protein/PAS domain S-box-containing protein
VLIAEFAGLIADSVSTGLLVATTDRRVVWVNRAIVEMVGAQSLPARFGAGGPGSAESPRAAARAAVAAAGLPLSDVGPGDPPRRRSWVDPTGETRWLEIRCRELARDADLLGVGRLVVFEVADVTEEQAVGVAVDTRARERLARFEEIAHTGTWDWDTVTGRVNWSPHLLELLGFPPDAVVDFDTVRGRVHPEDLPAVEATVRQSLVSGEPFTSTHRMTHVDGVSERVFECNGQVSHDATGRPVHVMVTAHDVTELYRVHRELAYLAEHDSLTGLRNRRAMTRELGERFAATPEAAADRAGALLLIDVDHFKDVNDLRGHAVGDAVMRVLAQVLREELPDAVLGRLGGDEFAVILAAGGGQDALEIAESVCDAVAARAVVADDVALRATVSVGVASLADAEDGASALARADLALYQAKRAGRNCARLYARELYEHAARRVSVGHRVRNALEAGLMSVDALPLVDLETRLVVGYELLVRLRDGQEPELAPRGFLAEVERTDLVLELDRWVVGQAVDALATQAARDRLLHLHVNISSRSLEDPGFGDFVLAQLHEARVEPSRLGLEITESVAITSLDAARRLAEQLTADGCRFTLDDFGAAMGSFVHLRNLPFTTVKIDGELVRSSDTNAEDTAIVDAIVRIARTMGMYTIAENVDRAELAEILRDLGVDFAQGFGVGRPRPLGDLLAAGAAEAGGAHGDAVAGLDSPVGSHAPAGSHTPVGSDVSAGSGGSAGVGDLAPGAEGGAGAATAAEGGGGPVAPPGGGDAFADLPPPGGAADRYDDGSPPPDAHAFPDDARGYPDAGQLVGYRHAPDFDGGSVYLESAADDSSARDDVRAPGSHRLPRRDRRIEAGFPAAEAGFPAAQPADYGSYTDFPGFRGAFQESHEAAGPRRAGDFTPREDAAAAPVTGPAAGARAPRTAAGGERAEYEQGRRAPESADDPGDAERRAAPDDAAMTHPFSINSFPR